MDLILKACMFVAVIVAALFAQAEVHSPRPEIAVKSEIEVSEKSHVRLIDISSVNFVTLDQAHSALEMTLFDGPADGQQLNFKNRDLVKIIKDKISQSQELASLKWTYFVPEQVQVTGKKILLSPLSAENQIQMAILAKCGDCKVAVKDLRIPSNFDAAVVKNCQLVTDGLKPGGTFLLPLQCEASGQARTFWISGTARVSKLAPVSLRQITPGDRITAKDFRVGEVDLTYARDGVASSLDLPGQVAGRLILVNQPIFRSDIKKELAVSRGQMVKAVMGDDTFEVTSSAVAEEQGYVGDTVRIKAAESQKELSGVVVEKGVVRVQ